MTKTLALSFALLFAFQGQAMTNQKDRLEVEQKQALDYLIALPDGYDAEGDAVPVLLFLHGAGERGKDLDKVKMHGPPKMIESGHAFEAIVVSPQCPADSWWSYETDALIALLDKIERAYNVDPKRIYLTGLSMGGYGTFALAARQPERFAAAVPICGGGERYAAWRLNKLPMWVFHGEDDKVVPVEESKRLVEIIKQDGGEKVKMTLYPGVGHNSWDKAYADKAMWKWLFEQRR